MRGGARGRQRAQALCGTETKQKRVFVQRLKRIAAKAVYRLSRIARRFRKRSPLGATIAVVFDSKLLVIQHSYRRGMALPGGRVKRGEEPIRAAARELREEVGIVVATDALRPVYADLWKRIFEYRPEARPEIRIALGGLRY